MDQSIQAGPISDMLISIFNKCFKDLESRGFKNSEYKKVKSDDGEETGFSFTCTSEQGHQFHVKALKSAGRSNLYDYYIVGDNGSKKKFTHRPDSDLDNVVSEFLESFYDEPDSADIDEGDYDSETAKMMDIDDNGFESANSSKKIQISLSKVQSSSEVVLGPIYCNYDEFEVYEDLENVLDSEEFIDDLSEDPQMFEIIPSEDEYTIEPIDSIEPMNFASQVIRAQFITLMQLYSTKWNSDCLLDENPLSFISTIRWQLDWMISSQLAALNVDIAEILKSITSEEIEPDGDVSNIVENYCMVLDLYYPNFSHEVQSLLDEWLLTLRYR